MDRQKQVQTFRMRVLAVLESSPVTLTGREISLATGVPYKQTIDALNGLLNYGRVSRTGHKFTARWSRVQAAPSVCNLSMLINNFERNRK